MSKSSSKGPNRVISADFLLRGHFSPLSVRAKDPTERRISELNPPGRTVSWAQFITAKFTRDPSPLTSSGELVFPQKQEVRAC